MQTQTGAAPFSPTDHPHAQDVNAAHLEKMSRIERACKLIADKTGSPWALIMAAVLQLAWIVVGIVTHFDPFPFVFLLTCSNVIQLILIFVLAVGQRQSASHAELRAETDHDAIARLLHHSELQEGMLLSVFASLGIEAGQAGVRVAALADAQAGAGRE